jgi:DNA-binding GntR family transcriptional regulator
MDRIERPRSLTELVCDALRREIVEGELEPGQMLSETKVAARRCARPSPGSSARG